jgi:pantoate--beta-alanine ligase
MRVITDIEPCRRVVLEEKREGRVVGLVPTMGALHEGHRSLIRASKGRCDVTAVTIFVNPTQFAPGEDLDAYPRPLEQDLAICREDGVDIVFSPDVGTMYPPDARTRVCVDGLTSGLCGAHRPGHFDGVTTVVAKLFNILPADFAFFGEKDYQQLIVIQRMVRDLNLGIEIVPCPTVREADGLAMSSRNAYLSSREREQALALSRSLFAAQRRIAEGECDVARIVEQMRGMIADAGPVKIDYIEIVDPQTLEPLAVVDRAGRICLAVRIGKSRLIDNIAVDVPCSQG